jgi:molecular chaperone IbpA
MTTQKPPSFDAIFNRLNEKFVGFDHLMREFTDTLNSASVGSAVKYPPYDIIQLDEDNYEIVLAIAGFDPTEIEVAVTDGYLNIKSVTHPGAAQPDTRKYIYKGVAKRAFDRQFKLGEYMEILSAEYTKGLLTIQLQRQVPDKKKSKTISIAIKGN